MCHSRVLHCFTMVVVASEAAAVVGCRAAAVAAVRLPPCPTQSSCRWQCHCNANIGIETFFSTEATDSLSLYPPKSSGTYRDGGIFPCTKCLQENIFCHNKCAKLCNCTFFYDWSPQPNSILFRRACPPSSSGSVLPTSFFPLDQSKQS